MCVCVCVCVWIPLWDRAATGLTVSKLDPVDGVTTQVANLELDMNSPLALCVCVLCLRACKHLCVSEHVYCIVSVHTSRYTASMCVCVCVCVGSRDREDCMCLYSTSSVRLYGSGPPKISPPGCEIAPSRENDINMRLSLPPLILELLTRASLLF